MDSLTRKLVEYLVVKAEILLSSHVCSEHGTGACSDRANLERALRELKGHTGIVGVRYGGDA